MGNNDKTDDKIINIEDLKKEKDNSSEEDIKDSIKEEEIEQTEEVNEEEIEETETFEEKYNNLNDTYLRLAADFDNFRKRAIKEKEETIIYSVSNFASDLLPIIDNFKRALEIKEDEVTDKSFYEGIEMIYNQLNEVLQKEGIEKFTDEGEKFDPARHCAVTVDKVEDKDNDIILEVFQDGYIYKQKILRPAMVKVNKK